MMGRNEDSYIVLKEVKKFGYRFIIYIKVPLITRFSELLDLTMTLQFEL